MNNSYENLKSIFLLFIFSAVVALFIFSDDGAKYDYSVLSTSYLICQIALLKIFRFSKYSFSLDNILNLFFIFFIGLAGALQYKQDITFWGALRDLNESDYLYGNIIMLSILITYNLSYNLFLKKQVSDSSKVNIDFSLESVKTMQMILILMSIVAVLIFAYSKNFNLNSILFRGQYAEAEEGGGRLGGALGLIVNIFVRPIPLVCLLIYKLVNYDRKTNIIVVLLLLSLTLFSNSPSGMPRFQAASLYIPLMLVYSSQLRNRFNFALFFPLFKLMNTIWHRQRFFN